MVGKSKTLKNPYAFQQNPKKSLDLKLILLLLKM